MTETNETAEPSGASGGYLVFAEFGPLCWRRPKPLRKHATLDAAILEANERAAKDTGSFGDVEWVVSTGRDGPCLHRAAQARQGVSK